MIISDRRDVNGRWVKWERVDGVLCCTKSANAWYDVVNRCKDNGSTKKRRPTYTNCKLSEDFANFQIFADWYTSQIGYNKGYELDKDLLYHNNKIYSTEHCVLIPRKLNMFISISRPSKGLPVGVSIFRGKIQASISIDSKIVKLGNFQTVEEAFAAYKLAKEKEARRWYFRLASGEFEVDPRVIERMRVWVVEYC